MKAKPCLTCNKTVKIYIFACYSQYKKNQLLRKGFMKCKIVQNLRPMQPINHFYVESKTPRLILKIHCLNNFVFRRVEILSRYITTCTLRPKTKTIALSNRTVSNKDDLIEYNETDEFTRRTTSRD